MFEIFSRLSHALAVKQVHKRIHKLLINNKIQVLHFLPGRIRLSSPIWIKNPKIVEYLIAELEREPRIESATYTKETGTLLILYDKSPLQELSQIEQWLEKAERLTHLLEKEGGRT